MSPSNEQDNKRCDVCLRIFSRAEHLARHRRIHTQEKPFTCPYCRRSFQRSDVKAAHAQRCRAAPSHRPNDAPGDGGPVRKRARVACVVCRHKKLRCDGSQPCAPCLSTDSACHYRAVATSSSASVSTPRTEAAVDALPEQTIGDLVLPVPVPVPENASERTLDFTLQHSSLQNESSFSRGLDLEVSFDTDLNTTQSHDLNALHREFPRQTELIVSESMTYDVPNMLISPDDVFGQFPDVSSMDDYWQMAPMNMPFWFAESDFPKDGIFFDSEPLVDHVIPSSMQSLTASMQEYFDTKSRPPSPSLNKASRMWYSAPPNLNDHNKDVVRVFLNIFRKHIPQTFTIFKDTTDSQNGRAAYILAMAATGGLFCPVSGSAEVAKSMYNDARRLLLASLSMRDDFDDLSATPEDKLVRVKTFVLLALYGLCSGDKRSYEFAEAFHADLIDSVQEYSQALKAAELDEQRKDDNVR